MIPDDFGGSLADLPTAHQLRSVSPFPFALSSGNLLSMQLRDWLELEEDMQLDSAWAPERCLDWWCEGFGLDVAAREIAERNGRVRCPYGRVRCPLP